MSVKNWKRIPVVKMQSTRHSTMLKGKAIILALSEEEKSRIYNGLDVVQKAMFTGITNYVYSYGG